MVRVLTDHCRLTRHLHLLSIEPIPICQNAWQLKKWHTNSEAYTKDGDVRGGKFFISTTLSLEMNSDVSARTRFFYEGEDKYRSRVEEILKGPIRPSRWILSTEILSSHSPFKLCYYFGLITIRNRKIFAGHVRRFKFLINLQYTSSCGIDQ